MTEVNKEELRRKAKDAISPNGFEPLVIFRECATPAVFLSLLDELDRANGMCAKHGKALQEIGSALSLGAGADLHRDCTPAVYRLFQSIGSGVSEAYKERMACQRVIDQLRAEVESLRSQLKACHPFRPALEPVTVFAPGCLVCGQYTDHGGLQCPKTRAACTAQEGSAND